MARHGLAARVIHAALLIGIGVLLISGLGLSDHLPPGVVRFLGGHLAIDDLHRQLGLAVTLGLVIMVLIATTQVRRLVHDVTRFRSSDVRWPVDFVRCHLWPKSGRRPVHDGRFDPGQRLVFSGIIGSVAILGATGVYVYISPTSNASIMTWTLRLHIVSGWALIVCVVSHIIGGSGILPTHRGIARTMFGRGQVDPKLAARLWPVWTRIQTGQHGRSTNGDTMSAPETLDKP